MKRSHLLVLAAMAAALGVNVPARAASDCIQFDLGRIGTVCRGQPATLKVQVSNICSESKRANVKFAIDRVDLRGKEAMVLAPLETISRDILVPLPVTTQAGLRALTITVDDIAGNVDQTNVALNVEPCGE